MPHHSKWRICDIKRQRRAYVSIEGGGIGKFLTMIRERNSERAQPFA